MGANVNGMFPEPYEQAAFSGSTALAAFGSPPPMCGKVLLHGTRVLDSSGVASEYALTESNHVLDIA